MPLSTTIMKLAIICMAWLAWLLWSGAWLIGEGHPPSWATLCFFGFCIAQTVASRRRKPNLHLMLIFTSLFLVGLLGLWWTHFRGPVWQVGLLVALFCIGALSTASYAIFLEMDSKANGPEA